MQPKKTFDEESPAYQIAMKFGSKSAFARALGRLPSTTARWLYNGSIPGEYHAEVIAAAKGAGIQLIPTDFVDLRLFAE